MTWRLEADDALPLWRRNPPDRAVLAFSTRRGGVSGAPFDTLNLGRSTDDDPEAIAENRRRLLHALALDPDRLATAGQVHGATVRETAAPGHVAGCDALVTRTPALALAVTSADCMAILYDAPGAVGAAHSGWRGTVAGMPVAALHAVARLAGVGAGEVRVHLGPCIRGCCYEVGDSVAAQFPAAAVRREAGRQWLDLPTAARLQLTAAGVAADAVHDTAACTACEPHWYFSHRRDQGRTGRLWGIAAVSPS